MTASRFQYFVAVSPGLESALVRELEGLGLAAKARPGGAELTGPREDLWRLHRASRLAENIRLRLKPFHARTFAELTAQLPKLPWHAYLPRGASVRIDVSCHKSRLYHSDAVAERVRGVLEQQRDARPPSTAEHEHRVFVRLVRDRVQISIDASGRRLHRRGYRTHVTRAPLRETLAAAMVLLLAEHCGDSSGPVWDPFCGSGTLPLEWSLFVCGKPPGAGRVFAFEQWPVHDAEAYDGWLGRQVEIERALDAGSPTRPLALGSDVSARAIAAARHNAESAGISEDVSFWQAGFERAARAVPEGTRILTNPPFGVRLRQRSPAQLLLDFERLLRDRADLRPVITLCPEGLRPGHARLKWQNLVRFSSGGLPVSAWLLPA